MALTRPQFVLGYTIAEGVDIHLLFTDTTSKVLSLGAPAFGPLFNNRTGSAFGVLDTDMLAWLAAGMHTQDGVGNTWSWAEVPGNILGRSRLINSARSDGKTLDTLTFQSGITGDMLGYDSDIVSVADPLEIDGPFVRGRLWIPHSDSVEPLGMVDDAHDQITLVESVTPTANIVQDDYGTITTRRILVSPIDAPFVKAHYANQADYLLVDQTIEDPHAPFDLFCKEWISLTGTAKNCRYYPEAPDPVTLSPTVNVSILPMAEWLGNVEKAATTISEAPLLYQLDIECWEA